MPQWYARAVIEHTSRNPADRCINGFAFEADTADDVAVRLIDFYNLGPGGLDGFAPSGYMATALDRTPNSSLIEVYAVQTPAQLEGAPLGSPVLRVPWQLGPSKGPHPGFGGNTADLPTEVAVVLSYQADLSGVQEELPGPAPRVRPRARRRGKLYIGPLSLWALQSNTAGEEQRVSVDFRDSLLDAAAVLGTSGVPTDAAWRIWSRSDGVMRPVVLASVDDAFDTQRRRGIRQQSRITIGV